MSGAIREMAPADGGISWSAQEDEARERADDLAGDDAREQAWAAFIATARSIGRNRSWPYLLKTVADVLRRGPSESQRIEVWLADFAEIETWPGVLRALARSMEM